MDFLERPQESWLVFWQNGLQAEECFAYHQALTEYDQGYQVALDQHDPIGQGECLNARGKLCHNLQRTNEALDAYEQALALALPPSTQAKVVHNYALLLLDLNHLAQAEQLFQTVISLSPEAENPDGHYHTYLNLAGLYRQQNKRELAYTQLEKALDLALKLNRPDYIAQTESNLGYLYLNQGNLAGAQERIEKAYTIYQQSGRYEHLPILLRNLSFIAYKQGCFEDAWNWVSAISVLFEQQWEGASPEFRRDLADSQFNALMIGSLALVKMGQFEEAWSQTDRYLNRVMQERLGLDPANTVALAQIQASLGEDEAMLVLANVKKIELVAFCLTRHSLQGQVLLPQERLAELNAQLAPKDFNGLAEMRTFMLGYLDPLKSAGPQDRHIFQALMKWLYQLFIAPFEALLEPINKIWLAPEGLLGQFPFAYLSDNQGITLLERGKSVNFIPSPTLFYALRHRSHSPAQKILGIGGADYAYHAFTRAPSPQNDSEWHVLRREIQAAIQAGDSLRDYYCQLFDFDLWPALPNSLAEISLLQHLDAEACLLLSGQAASKTHFLQLPVGEFALIHFALHGCASPRYPELSALVFSQSQAEVLDDGYLRLDEIIKLKLNAELVVISACNSGTGRVFQGEGVFGLAQAFLIAGARQVLVSLVPIGDQAVYDFMRYFYSVFPSCQGDAARALSLTQGHFLLKAEQESASPAFVLWGASKFQGATTVSA